MRKKHIKRGEKALPIDKSIPNLPCADEMRREAFLLALKRANDKYSEVLKKLAE